MQKRNLAESDGSIKRYLIVKYKIFIVYKFVILIFVLIIGCQTNDVYLKSEITSVNMAPGFKGIGLQKVICYNYTFKGKTYKQCSKIDHILVDAGDTVKISFNSKTPEKAKVLSVIRTVSKYENKVIHMDSSDRIYSYHRVDEKPLFSIAKSFAENDLLVDQFIIEEVKKAGIKADGNVSISLTIKSDGEVVIRKISSDNLDLEIFISECIKKMPKWQPGKKNGKFVNVSFLVDLNF